MLSPGLLAILAPLLIGGALFLPLHFVLLARYPLVVFPGLWEIGGVRFDPTDLVMAATVLGLVLRRQLATGLRDGGIPYLRSWLLLGFMASLAFVKAPMNEQYLGEPLRVAYQLFRYSWGLILFYPLCALLLTDRKKVETAALIVVMAGDLCGLKAIPQGYSGMLANSFFHTGNAFVGALMIPFVLSAAMLLRGNQRTPLRLFYLISFLVMGRAILFTGSRGGVLASLAAFSVLAGCLFLRSDLRPRLFRGMAAATLAVVVLLVLKPDVLERPTVKTALSAREGTQAGTMQWRFQHRWPHFIEIIKENPWFGTGSAVDGTLGERANTPHNGYLTIAVRSGIPVLLGYLLFAGRAIRDGMRSALRRSATDQNTGLLLLGLVAGLSGLLVHNLVDSTIRVGFAADLFWLICAVTASAPKWVGEESQEMVEEEDSLVGHPRVVRV